LQRHEWYVTDTFELEVSDDLNSAHVRGRFAVGGYIDMRFEARGPGSQIGPFFPGWLPRCHGEFVRRAGSLVGTVRLPTGAGRFGTVVRHRFRGWLARGDDLLSIMPEWQAAARRRRGAVV
jgi:hypothetical protein